MLIIQLMLGIGCFSFLLAFGILISNACLKRLCTQPVTFELEKLDSKEEDVYPIWKYWDGSAWARIYSNYGVPKEKADKFTVGERRDGKINPKNTKQIYFPAKENKSFIIVLFVLGILGCIPEIIYVWVVGTF